MRVYKAPHKPEIHPGEHVLFLAGSIEMGAAEEWQSYVEKELDDLPGVILNPRRDRWDSSWEQSIDNPNFNEQVTWELDGLDLADTVLINFDPKTKSPITIGELGLHAHEHKRKSTEMGTTKQLFVCCPQGFWRKGNIDIICHRYGILPVFEDLDVMLNRVRHRIRRDISLRDRMASTIQS